MLYAGIATTDFLNHRIITVAKDLQDCLTIALFFLFFLCLLVSKPGQAEKGSRPPKKKRRKSKKEDEKTNAPATKQGASNANKLAPEQKANTNKSAPPGVTQNKNKSSDTGKSSRAVCGQVKDT